MTESADRLDDDWWAPPAAGKSNSTEPELGGAGDDVEGGTSGQDNGSGGKKQKKKRQAQVQGAHCAMLVLVPHPLQPCPHLTSDVGHTQAPQGEVAPAAGKKRRRVDNHRKKKSEQLEVRTSFQFPD